MKDKIIAQDDMAVGDWKVLTECPKCGEVVIDVSILTSGEEEECPKCGKMLGVRDVKHKLVQA